LSVPRDVNILQGFDAVKKTADRDVDVWINLSETPVENELITDH